VGTETAKEAASATEGSRVGVLNLQGKREKATTAIDLCPGMGRQRFVVCTSWASVKLATVAVASITRHAASSREGRVQRARTAHFLITSLLLLPLRATKKPQNLRVAKKAELEAAAGTKAEHEARLRVRGAAFVARDAGEPEAAQQLHFSAGQVRRRKDTDLKSKKKKKTSTRTNPLAICLARPLRAAT
jgi:hypothetical protein